MAEALYCACGYRGTLNPDGSFLLDSGRLLSPEDAEEHKPFKPYDLHLIPTALDAHTWAAYVTVAAPAVEHAREQFLAAAAAFTAAGDAVTKLMDALSTENEGETK